MRKFFGLVASMLFATALGVAIVIAAGPKRLPPIDFNNVRSCEDVRRFAKQYGVEELERQARAAGVPVFYIELGRACLLTS